VGAAFSIAVGVKAIGVEGEQPTTIKMQADPRMRNFLTAFLLMLGLPTFIAYAFCVSTPLEDCHCDLR
jgi:hypothetical protein